MSVAAIGSPAPDPGFFSYPSIPAAPETASSASSSPSTATSSTPGVTPSATGTAAISSYQGAYDTLMQQDAAELLQVSLASPASAESNVADVLAQAAALQDAQLAAQRQGLSTTAAPAAAAPQLPTLSSLQQQSDADASTDLSNGTLGASIDDFA